MAAITLPPIPPQPAADATPAVWDVYLRILALYSAAAGQDSAAKTQDAINAQTAQRSWDRTMCDARRLWHTAQSTTD